MSLRIPIDWKKHLTIISVYAPTMTYEETSKDQFYSQLDVLVSGCKNDKLIIMGDFNARVGQGHMAWPNVLGYHGVGKTNSNGERLLNFCAQHGLIITNTLFKSPDAHKTTWMHPRSKHWHQIDFVLT